METFLLMLMACSVVTTLMVEATKKMIGEGKKTSWNLVAAIESVIVAAALSTGYLIITGTALSAQIWVYIIALIVFSWMCSMLGFDKVKQMLLQIKAE